MQSFPIEQIDNEYDVVVVGGGGAGLSAAVSAAQNGSKVIVLEKQEQPGGTTKMSVGSVTAARTELQQKKGYQDSEEQFEEDIKTYAGTLVHKDNPVLRKLLIKEAPITVSWLQNLGVSFVGPFFEPPHQLPRMHNAIPSGKAYIVSLLEQCHRLKVQIVTGARVSGLIQSNGKVSSVKFNKNNVEREITAKRGVVLATGDYSNGVTILDRFVSKEARMIGAVNEASTGDGHLLGESVGGVLVNMEMVDAQVRFPPPPIPPFLDRLPLNKTSVRILTLLANYVPRNVFRLFAKQILTARMAPSEALFESGAILINEQGKRFTDELDFTAFDVAQKANGQAYLILDSKLVSKFSTDSNYISTAPGIAYANWKDYLKGRQDLIKSGRTISELANKLGINASTLEETVANYNKIAKGTRLPLNEGPFYSMGPLLSLFMITDGSLLIDERCRVLNSEGKWITGLFAAGSVGQGGMLLPGHGLHLQWAFTSGRIAGQTAATIPYQELEKTLIF